MHVVIYINVLIMSPNLDLIHHGFDRQRVVFQERLQMFLLKVGYTDTARPAYECPQYMMAIRRI